MDGRLVLLGLIVAIAVVIARDIHLRASGGSYVQRVTGTGIDATLERRGADVVRLEVGDRPAPRLASGC